MMHLTKYMYTGNFDIWNKNIMIKYTIHFEYYKQKMPTVNVIQLYSDDELH